MGKKTCSTRRNKIVEIMRFNVLEEILTPSLVRCKYLIWCTEFNIFQAIDESIHGCQGAACDEKVVKEMVKIFRLHSGRL